MPSDLPPRSGTHALQAIAIVDDDAPMRAAMENLVRALGYEARAFHSGTALLAADLGRIDLVISDLQMPEMSGLELQARLQDRAPDLPFVLMTAFPEERLKLRALAAGARAFLEKPCDVDELVDLISKLVGLPGEPS